MSRDSQPVFYYDLASPACYLLAERIMAALPVAPEWEPVLWQPETEVDWESLAEAAQAEGLLPLRPPQTWPPDAREAMLAATYAKRAGRAVAFSLAAFRQAYAGGRDIGDIDTVLIAAAACEMHPTAMLKGISLRSVREGLELAGERARAAGVTSVPAIQVGDRVYSTAEEATTAL